MIIIRKNDNIENESNTGDYVKPTIAADSSKITQVKKIIMTEEKKSKIQ